MCYQLQGVRPRYMPEQLFWDRHFVQLMRDELNSQVLDLFYDARSDRAGLGVPADRDHYSFVPGLRGCWTLINWSNTFDRVDVGDQAVGFSVPVPVVVFVLNGDRGRPLMPGRWLIEVMQSRDRLGHGFVELERRVDDVTERSAMMKHHAGKKGFTEKWRDDKNLFRLLRKRGQELHGITADKQEVLQAERNAEKKLEQMEERAKRRAKEDRLWHNDRPKPEGS